MCIVGAAPRHTRGAAFPGLLRNRTRATVRAEQSSPPAQGCCASSPPAHSRGGRAAKKTTKQSQTERPAPHALGVLMLPLAYEKGGGSQFTPSTRGGARRNAAVHARADAPPPVSLAPPPPLPCTSAPGLPSTPGARTRRRAATSASTAAITRAQPLSDLLSFLFVEVRSAVHFTHKRVLCIRRSSRAVVRGGRGSNRTGLVGARRRPARAAPALPQPRRFLLVALIDGERQHKRKHRAEA